MGPMGIGVRKVGGSIPPSMKAQKKPQTLTPKFYSNSQGPPNSKP